MKQIFIIIILVSSIHFTFSQESKMSNMSFNNCNSIQIELFGHGLFYSLNYERIVINGERFKTSAQLGFSYYPPSTGVRDIWIPFLLNEIMSFKNHHIELGMGYIFINEAVRTVDNEVESRFWDGILTGRIGYRYQKPGGRLMLRVAFTPLLEYSEPKEFHPSGGLAIGYSF